MNRKSTWTSVLLLIMLACLNLTNLNTILYSEYPELVREDKVDRVFELRTQLDWLDQLVGKNGVIGHVSDIDPEKESSEFQKQRGLLQYAIVPIRISSSGNGRYVIGTFFKSTVPSSIKEMNLEMLKKINDNLAIYVREVN